MIGEQKYVQQKIMTENCVHTAREEGEKNKIKVLILFFLQYLSMLMYQKKRNSQNMVGIFFDRRGMYIMPDYILENNIESL